MGGVGLPGGPHRSRSGRGNQAKASEYRHTEAGMMARRLRSMNPERKAYLKIKREMKRHLHGGT